MSENNQPTAKSKSSTLKIALIIIVSVFVIIILIIASIAYAVNNFYKTVRGDLFGNNPEYIAAICPNSDVIGVSRKEVNIFGLKKLNYSVSYKRASDNNKPYPPSFDLDAPNDTSVSSLDFTELNKKNTIQYTFPFIRQLQNSFDYRVIDQNKINQNQNQQLSVLTNKNHINLYVQKNIGWDYKGGGYEGADGIPATYINPTQMTKAEFEGMVGCLKDAAQGNYKLAFFGLSTFAFGYLLVQFYNTKSKALETLTPYIVFGWCAFPIIFLLSNEGFFNVISLEVAALIYLVLDIFTKIIFYIHHSKIKTSTEA